jgi:hypothetical protein
MECVREYDRTFAGRRLSASRYTVVATSDLCFECDHRASLHGADGCLATRCRCDRTREQIVADTIRSTRAKDALFD